MAEGKLILTTSLSRSILRKIYTVTHMGVRWMADKVRQSKVTFRNMQHTMENIVSSCKACQLTNTHNTVKHSDSCLQGKRPGAYWEVDFTEIKPGKYGQRYLLVFVDTFSG